VKIKYIDRNFAASSLSLIEHANTIIAEYAGQGYKLTLRQLYYQFVARDLIANKTREYKRLGSVINDARLAGLIDWEAIEDRGRNLRGPATWSSPASIIETCSYQFKLDLWADQEYVPEVWIEKEALVSVAEAACRDTRVSSFACKGYVSQSEMWNAGDRRFGLYAKANQTPVIIHLGDHDPSGIDMTRDIADRASMFFGERVDVRRVALNMDQVDEYGPPPNPAKVTDSRFATYAQAHGTESWELDALNPDVLVRIIKAEIEKFIDRDKWAVLDALEKKHRRTITRISENFDTIAADLNGDDESEVS